MKTKQKPKYSMMNNTLFMISVAWKTNKMVLVLVILMALASAGETVVQMLIAPSILNQVETSASLQHLMMTILGFCAVLMLLSGIKAYLEENVIYGRIATRTHIIQLIDQKVSSTSYPNILDTEFVALENKASQATSSNDQSVEHFWTTWTNIFTNLIGFAVYLALLSGLSAALAALVIITSVVGFFIGKYIREWGYRHRAEETAYQEKLNYIQTLSTQRTYAKDIRIFGLEKWLEDVWNSTMTLYDAFIWRREKIYSLAAFIDLGLTLLRNGIVYVYLIEQVVMHGMSASEFLLYFSAVSGFTAWITGILEQVSKLHTESIDISSVREYLDWPEPFLFEGGLSLDKNSIQECVIELEDVSFRYPKADHDTISHLSLTIHAKEKLAIVGLNGAGKTTLVKLICGFLDPTEGRVLFNGQDIRTFNRKEYYALFSAVFQDFSLLEASVAENVAQKIEGIDKARVEKCLDQAGLSEKIASFPEGIETKLGRQIYDDGIELSGGQTQRLMLARALYKDGLILTLDEPTAALDPIAENDIYMKYNEMTKGKTSVFISHRLASTRFCDRILYLENGQISEEGSHHELIARNGGYAHLFEVQSQYYKEGEMSDVQ